MQKPMATAYDPTGTPMWGYTPHIGDQNVASGPVVPYKTGLHRIVVFDEKNKPNKPFTLKISKGYKPGGISGTLTDSRGVPVREAEVLVFKRYGSRFITYDTVTTDVMGEYTIKRLKPGQYKLRFTDDWEERVSFYRQPGKRGATMLVDGSVVKVKEGRVTQGIDAVL
jgi:hypothetical protein